MSRRRVVIEFAFPQDEQVVYEQNLISRVRDLGEDLFYEFSQNVQAIISLLEVDRAITQLSFTLSHTRHTGSVLRFVNQRLERHNLADIAQISTMALNDSENST
jgi:hypothetical protein